MARVPVICTSTDVETVESQPSSLTLDLATTNNSRPRRLSSSSPAHHQLMRPTYLHTTEEFAQFAIAHILQGCVNSRVPKTVRHGTSLHRICLKLLIDSSPVDLSQLTRFPVDSSPRRLSVDRWQNYLAQFLLELSPRRLSVDQR